MNIGGCLWNWFGLGWYGTHGSREEQRNYLVIAPRKGCAEKYQAQCKSYEEAAYAMYQFVRDYFPQHIWGVIITDPQGTKIAHFGATPPRRLGSPEQTSQDGIEAES